MNAVEIEEAVAQLAMEPFNAAEFPFAFLAAFDNKPATIARLRAGATNASDVPGGVLQRNHIHLATCAPGKVTETLAALKASPRTAKAKAKFVLATDGEHVEAQDLVADEPLACPFGELAKHFGFFLPLAGITTVQEIKDNPIDIKATGRLFKLYVQMLNDNPEWTSEARRHDLNQFMARLIFCFFAEDTGIFQGNGLFTGTIRQVSDASNTHEVLGQIFRAMDIPLKDRDSAKLPTWADAFPHVNGGLFAGTQDTPIFSKAARIYLLAVGELDWKDINPDIFGSMIQGIADDEERGSLGMHYTSVPNILKVLDPLFLDDLRESLHEAGDNARKLLNLRKRIASIRVFDPACGSGNFLVIAYIKMREIEAEIIRRRNDEKKSWIKLTNFYGIEIKDFACETARLSLLIAEFQCDARLIGQREACLNILPLKQTGQIRCDNALRIDWAEVCPSTPGSAVEHDLAGPTGRLALDTDASYPEETYLCGNPPYAGSKTQTVDQRRDLAGVFEAHTSKFKTLDYVSAWILKASRFVSETSGSFAFVTTNSICQGEQVSLLWPHILRDGMRIEFAHRSFKWSNLASNNAGVTCVIVGVGKRNRPRFLFEEGLARRVQSIGAYLLEMDDVYVEKRARPVSSALPAMQFGNHAYYATDLVMSPAEAKRLANDNTEVRKYLRPMFGAEEYIHGTPRVCVWIKDADAEHALSIDALKTLALKVEAKRRAARKDATAQKLASVPYRFRDQVEGKTNTLIVPRHSSETRHFLPIGLLPPGVIVPESACVIYDAPLWAFSLLVSRLHLSWIATVCGKLETRYRYSSTLGWNTFPVRSLTANNRAELTRCAEDILIAREVHFPATIADLYEPDAMPENLRVAHDKNDETIERIFIGRKFRSEAERLEKLFELYRSMTAKTGGTE